jgi:hypothetical protein
MARESKQARHEKRFGKPERFADWLMEHPISSQANQGNDMPNMRSAVARSMKVDVNNVADYAVGFRGKPWEPESFPCCVPPHNPTFMEYQSPFDSRHRIGFLVGRPSDSDAEDKVFAGHLIIASKDLAVASVVCDFTWDVDDSGDLNQVRCWNEDLFASTRYLIPFLLSMSLMNCKNTTVEPHEPDRKLNRERTRHSLKPFLRYHTINIEPMRKVLKTEGDIEANGLKKALHICRGHFRRYTDEKPLFGHTAGLVWTPSHVRGSAKAGVVVSDYKVNAPKQGA